METAPLQVGMCSLRMETPLRRRSGGHTGAAPTISPMAPGLKVAGEVLVDGLNRKKVAGEVLADEQIQEMIAGEVLAADIPHCLSQENSSPHYKHECIVVANSLPLHKNEFIVVANSSPRHKH